VRRVLVISDRVSISKNGERLKVTRGGRTCSLPVRYVDLIVVFGGVSLSSEVISLLLSSGVPVFFLTRFGRPKGVLTNGLLTSNYSRRLKQYRAHLEKQLAVARFIVGRKIERIEELFRTDLSDLKRELERCTGVDMLMGIEGTASRRMFAEFGTRIERSSLKFGGRSYRPPADGVNALLSLSYTLAYALAYPMTLLMGYDPYLSFLHTKRGGHASFCSDIIEPVRPLITERIVDPIVRGVFTRKDFFKEKGGVYLRKESFPKFLSWFESVKDEITAGVRDTLLALWEVME